jgi:3-oxoadipate enol-lactonase
MSTLSPEARQAVVHLARAVLSVKPLVNALDRPVRVASVSGPRSEEMASLPALVEPGEGSRETAGMARLLDRVAARLGAPQLALGPGLALADLDVFEHAVSHRLDLTLPGEPERRVPVASLPEVDEVVDEVLRASLPQGCARAEVLSFDGAPLRAYALGERRDRAVIIASACGGPVDLTELWMRRLAAEHLVITWESRGLFAETPDFDELAHDVTAQVADLFAVMDHFGVAGGHLMGLCGGAVIALAAAAAQPERASSLSLWYGDYELGPECPKTAHQQDLQSFLSMAGEDRMIAASLRRVFCRSLRGNSLPDLAHLILYPYASDELLFRYGRLNGSIMSTDVSPLLGRLSQSTLVVTSLDDTKAHPAGSRLVAAGLANAKLHVEPHGDHITLFHADPGITELAERFLSQIEEPESGGPSCAFSDGEG